MVTFFKDQKAENYKDKSQIFHGQLSITRAPHMNSGVKQHNTSEDIIIKELPEIWTQTTSTVLTNENLEAVSFLTNHDTTTDKNETQLHEGLKKRLQP